MRYGGESVTTFESPRLQSLLAYLLLHQGIPQPRQQIAFQFWPVSSESQARTNLRKLLLQFRRALPAAADQFFTSTNQTLLWHAEALSLCDVTEIQQLLANIEENPLARDGLMRLSDLYRGELLPTCYDEWITPLRRELHHNVTTALERLVTLLENQRAYEEGVRYAQRLLTFEPLEEKGYQRLMRLHALNGDRAGALRAYQECEAILQRELDVPPSEETQTVYAQLLEQAMDVVSPAEPQPARLERIPVVSRDQVHVIVEDGLAGLRAGVEHQAVAVLVALGGRDGVTGVDELGHRDRVTHRELAGVGEVRLGHDQHVGRRAAALGRLLRLGLPAAGLGGAGGLRHTGAEHVRADHRDRGEHEDPQHREVGDADQQQRQLRHPRRPP